jgi:hypothetical protein
VTTFEAALARIGHDLDELQRPWALVGALAVAAHAEARATLDVDVAVAVEGPADSAALVSALRVQGYRWLADFGDAMTSLAVRDAPPAGLRLDLLFSLAGIENEVARAAERIRVLPGLVLPVARRGDLIALKLLAAGQPGREHDWRDLRSLVAGASHSDLDRARDAIALLVARGAAATGGLEAELARLLDPAG